MEISANVILAGKGFFCFLDWKNVVQLYAVDCELDSNADICKEHNLNKYPTLKVGGKLFLEIDRLGHG